jgi:hypothetical protein
MFSNVDGRCSLCRCAVYACIHADVHTLLCVCVCVCVFKCVCACSTYLRYVYKLCVHNYFLCVHVRVSVCWFQWLGHGVSVCIRRAFLLQTCDIVSEHACMCAILSRHLSERLAQWWPTFTQVNIKLATPSI